MSDNAASTPSGLLARNAEGSTLVAATRVKFRDEFGWAAGELSTRYTTAGSTVAPTVAADRLSLTTGTTANAVCQAELPLRFCAPAQVVIAAQFTAANPANCDVSLELVDELDRVCAAFVFPGAATATQARVHTFSKSRLAPTENTTNLTVTDRVTSIRLYQFQLFPDEVRFAQRDPNSVNGRNTIAVRTYRVPDPDEPLAVRIRMANGATAPATATTLHIFGITITDINELPVDLTNTGGSSLGEAVPIMIAASNATVVAASRPEPSATAGSYFTTARTVTAATTNATLAKGAGGNIGGGSITNTSATAMWFKLFNLAAAPTVGTSVPVLTIPVPANSTANLSQYIPAQGLRLGTGLSWCLTAAPAHTDTAAVAAGSIVELFYV